MFSEGKVIFSRRFPDLDFEQMLKDRKPPEPSEIEPAPLEALEKAMAFIPNQEKIAVCSRFIELAKHIALAFKIDTEITQFEHYFRVALVLYSCDYMGMVKKYLVELMSMADHIAFQSGNHMFVIISLDCRTHDYYLNGRKID